MPAHPSHGTDRVLHTLVRRHAIFRTNTIVDAATDQTTFGKILSLRLKLIRRTIRPAAAEKENQDRTLIGRFPIRWIVEIDRQLPFTDDLVNILRQWLGLSRTNHGYTALPQKSHRSERCSSNSRYAGSMEKRSFFVMHSSKNLLARGLVHFSANEIQAMAPAQLENMELTIRLGQVHRRHLNTPSSYENQPAAKLSCPLKRSGGIARIIRLSNQKRQAARTAGGSARTTSTCTWKPLAKCSPAATPASMEPQQITPARLEMRPIASVAVFLRNSNLQVRRPPVQRRLHFFLFRGVRSKAKVVTENNKSEHEHQEDNSTKPKY